MRNLRLVGSVAVQPLSGMLKPLDSVDATVIGCPMAMYAVRWFDPRRPRPLTRLFHSREEAVQFRGRLPYLSEPPKRQAD